MNQRAFKGILVAFLLWAWAPNDAYAYPQYIAHGYATCGSCHYSPDGGGLLNAYGVAVTQALFPDDLDVEFIHSLRETLEKRIVSGEDDEGGAAFHWDLGLDIRFLTVNAVTEIGAGKELYFIPMLFEAQGVMAWDKWTLYASVTPKKTGNSKRRFDALSRQHWLQWRYSEELSLRVGRLVQPFGTRTPDHTVYVRRRLGFDKYDQSYGLQLDWNSQDWSVSAMGFLGDEPWRDWESQEKGLSATAAYLLPGRAAIGVSTLYGQTTFQKRIAGGIFTRLKGIGKSYLLLELDFQRKFNSTQAQNELAAYGRLGWFAREWLDLYGEFQRIHVLSHPGSMNRLPHEMGFNIGANMQILTWLELIPALQITELESEYDFAGLFQLHLIY